MNRIFEEKVVRISFLKVWCIHIAEMKAGREGEIKLAVFIKGMKAGRGEKERASGIHRIDIITLG